MKQEDAAALADAIEAEQKKAIDASNKIVSSLRRIAGGERKAKVDLNNDLGKYFKGKQSGFLDSAVSQVSYKMGRTKTVESTWE